MTDEGQPGASAALEDDRRADREHVDELPDGAGCTEIWEHLSERRGDGECAD